MLWDLLGCSDQSICHPYILPTHFKLISCYNSYLIVLFQNENDNALYCGGNIQQQIKSSDIQCLTCHVVISFLQCMVTNHQLIHLIINCYCHYLFIYLRFWSAAPAQWREMWNMRRSVGCLAQVSFINKCFAFLNG